MWLSTTEDKKNLCLPPLTVQTSCSALAMGAPTVHDWAVIEHAQTTLCEQLDRLAWVANLSDELFKDVILVGEIEAI